jgi:hypothetical protein
MLSRQAKKTKDQYYRDQNLLLMASVFVVLPHVVLPVWGKAFFIFSSL